MKAKLVDNDLRRSATEHRFNITAAVRHVKDQHVNAINAVDDDILAYGKLRKTGRKASRRRPT
jgi:hypothetical protein